MGSLNASIHVNVSAMRASPTVVNHCINCCVHFSHDYSAVLSSSHCIRRKRMFLAQIKHRFTCIDKLVLELRIPAACSSIQCDSV